MAFRRKPPKQREPATKITSTERTDTGRNPLSDRFQVADETPTVDLEESRLRRASARPTPAQNDPETRIISESRIDSMGPGIDRMDDPPSGWLVVVAGPGKGNAVEFGYGMNCVGRADSERVTLNFGDDRISREKHFTITYDEKSRKFYINHGEGNNLTYLGTEPVLQPVEILQGDQIAVGDTVLRFIPLCSQEFDWLADDSAST